MILVNSKLVQSSRVPHPGWSDGLPGGSGLRLSPGGGQADAESSFSHRETGWVAAADDQTGDSLTGASSASWASHPAHGGQVSRDQGELEGGRNGFWYWKDIELKCMHWTQLMQSKTALKLINHFLYLLLCIKSYLCSLRALLINLKTKLWFCTSSF